MVWPKDPPQSDAQPQASAKPQGVHPPDHGPITAQLGPAQWASRQPGPLTWTLLLLGPGYHCFLQKLSSLDVGNERRFVSADADNRRYHQKDHSAPQTTAPPSSGTSFSAPGARVYWSVVLCDL
ncbi:hypothetical protein E4U57_002706 [Claviceps arundinis]|uniref:Uncharacterized protein n=1 Tax=Claviceps arundinis TaxID=1623583 RepID=A0ABQ7P8J2_9HYPO|nr:hypothetical protein E4U57_002706 [Claviceps arundinis]